jgi:hypothetical protein
MTVKELTPENLTANQAKYFQPSKALPYKDYIIDKSLQGMTFSEIHRKLLRDFPGADVPLDSLTRLVKKYNKPKSKSRNGRHLQTKPGILNKSDEVRKLVKEMILDGVELSGTNIIKTLANRGIKVGYTHVAMAIGQAVINKEMVFHAPTTTTTPTTTRKTASKCSFDDIVAAKELADKLGGLDKAIAAIDAYNQLAKN